MRTALVFRLFLLVALVCSASTIALAGNGDALLPYVPSNAVAVVGVDVAAIRSTPTFETLMSAVGTQQQMERVTGNLERVGFNPREHIDTAVVAAMSFDRNDQPLLLVQGNIPRAAIEQALSSEGQATAEQVNGRTVYTRSGRGSFVFLSDTLAAIGPTRAVRAAAEADGSAARLSRSLRPLLASVDRSKSLWFLSGADRQLLGETPFRDATGLRGVADLSNGLSLSIHAVMPSADAAASTAASMQQQIATAAGRDEVAAIGLGPVISSIQSAQDGNAVRLTVQMNASLFRRTLNTVVSVVRDQLR